MRGPANSDQIPAYRNILFQTNKLVGKCKYLFFTNHEMYFLRVKKSDIDDRVFYKTFLMILMSRASLLRVLHRFYCAARG